MDLKVGIFSFECIIGLLIYFVFCKLSESTFYEEMSTFQQKYRVKNNRFAMMFKIP